MTEVQKRLLAAAGLTQEDLKPQPTASEVAEEAYLLSVYNNVLISVMMEE